MKFKFNNAGRFISRGIGRHPTRVIDSCELILVLSGTLELFEGDKSFHLRTGDRLFLFPGVRHGALSVYEPKLSFFWAHFYPDRQGFAALSKLPQTGRLVNMEFAVSYTQMLLAEQRRRILESGIQSNLDDLFRILLRECTLTVPSDNDTSSNRLADETDRFIKLRFGEDISTAKIAKKLGCNPDYLGRVYAKSRKCTIGDALRKLRISRALNLLETTAISIKQIAYDSGFNDPVHFRRQFFRECAMTPGKYRKMHTKDHINTE